MKLQEIFNRMHEIAPDATNYSVTMSASSTSPDLVAMVACGQLSFSLSASKYDNRNFKMQWTANAYGPTAETALEAFAKACRDQKAALKDADELLESKQ